MPMPLSVPHGKSRRNPDGFALPLPRRWRRVRRFAGCLQRLRAGCSDSPPKYSGGARPATAAACAVLPPVRTTRSPPCRFSQRGAGVRSAAAVLCAAPRRPPARRCCLPALQSFGRAIARLAGCLKGGCRFRAGVRWWRSRPVRWPVFSPDTVLPPCSSGSPTRQFGLCRIRCPRIRACGAHIPAQSANPPSAIRRRA